MEFKTQNAKLSNVGSYSKASNNIISFTYSNNFDKFQDIDVYEAIDYSIVEPFNQDGNSGSEFSIFDEFSIDTFNEIWDDLIGAKNRKYVFCALSAFGVGALSFGETIFDAGATIVGFVASKTGNELLADDIKYAVSQSAVSDLYEDCVDYYEIDDEMAYGTLYKVSNVLGSMAPYVLLNVLGTGLKVAKTAPKVVSKAAKVVSKAAKAIKIGVEGLSAAGSANQQAFEGGGSYLDSLTCGVVAGVAGTVLGSILDKIGSTSTNIMTTIKSALQGAVVAGAEPLINTFTQYETYAKDITDSNGDKKYDSLLDYYKESGGIMQTGIACAIGGFSAGSKALSNNKINNDAIERYKDKVYTADNNWDYKKNYNDSIKNEVAFNYSADTSKDFFDLTKDEQQKLIKEYMESEQILDFDEAIKSGNDSRVTAAKKLYDDQVNNSIEYVKKQYNHGTFNNDYSFSEILDNYDDADQFKYWSKRQQKKWLNNYGKYADKDGNIKVYGFQNGEEGSAGVVTFNAFGRPEEIVEEVVNDETIKYDVGGAFVISENEYKKILNNKNIFDKNGNCINSELLTSQLGGVDFGKGNKVIAVETTVNINDIKASFSKNKGAFPGFYAQGGSTLTGDNKKGFMEAIISAKSEGEYEIINHYGK